MSLHLGKKEYNGLIGKTIGESKIKDIKYNPDKDYMSTDGRAGKPYLLTLSNGVTLQFRHFEEVVIKFGHLKCDKCHNCHDCDKSDGDAGKPHLLTLSNGDTLQFQHFEELLIKYGLLKCDNCHNCDKC